MADKKQDSRQDKKKARQKILITAALPYANGPIHMGHMVEYIQTDIFARFMRLIGEHAIFCCADDTHGTPIEIAAMKKGVLPEQLIEEMHKEHLQDFTDFQVKFDSYYSTNSKENKFFSDFIFNELNKKKLIYQKEVELTYCEKCGRFLPDRYVKGRCPKCNADDQYGDVCEKCNAAYSTVDLVEPFCTICGSSPTKRKSTHYFFRLSQCSKQLKDWLEKNKNLQPEVKNYVLNWIKEGLKDWDITRDGPYFGFNIPGEKDKYYYVWLDAPIGYIASTENYCKNIAKGRERYEEYWKEGRIFHFMGKDIIYFHFLFWPAMLMNSGFTLPEDIIVHGYLTVNKEKMSKSRGTFFTARDYLKILDPQYLRFYYAANLSRTMSDIDLDFNDLKNRSNNELVADICNFTYRVLSFINKNFDSKLSDFDEKEANPLIAQLNKKFDEVRSSYLKCNFREAVKHILEVGSIGNKYFQESKPWEIVKAGKEGEKKAQQISTFCANIAKDISILIKPILPQFSAELEKQLGVKEQSWNDLGFSMKNCKINEAKIIIRKIEDELDRLKVDDAFSKLDLRAAKILEAREHPDSDKLLILQVDVGSDKRQIVAGMKKYYKPEELVGKIIVIIKNLKPAKLRGEVSAGMLLAGGDEKADIHRVLEAKNAKPGTRVIVDSIPSLEDDDMKEIKLEDFLNVKIEVNEGKAVYKGQALKAGKEGITCALDRGTVR